MNRDGPDTCLAVYGTLAPGEENAHLLAGLAGHWSEGTVKGSIGVLHWGTSTYPVIALDPAGETVRVKLFFSDDLPAHWARLDAFEGPDYARVPVAVVTDEGRIEACIYALAD